MPGHRIPDRLRFQILERDGFRCRYCGRSKDEPSVVLEVDHVVPVTKGGTDEPDNLLTSCEPCNQGKGARVGTVAPERAASVRDLTAIAEGCGLNQGQQRFAEALVRCQDPVLAATQAGCARPDIKGPRWAALTKVRRFIVAAFPDEASTLPVLAVDRPRGGQLGNLNATKHPWRTFWRRRALQPENRWLVPVLESYAEQLAADKGGNDAITAGEKRVLEIAQVARGAAMLIMAEAGRSGFTQNTEKGWDLHPGVKELGRFLGLERQALGDLGLGRRAKDVPNLQEYLQKKSAAVIDVPAEVVSTPPDVPEVA
jgi:hypothetical protein